MATFNNPNNPGGLSFEIPNQGETFVNKDDPRNQFLFTRQGNQVFHTLAPKGFDTSQLQGYNLADVGSAFASQGFQVGAEQNYRPFSQNLFANNPQAGGNISVTADPMLAGGLSGARQIAQQNNASLPQPQIAKLPGTPLATPSPTGNQSPANLSTAPLGSTAQSFTNNLGQQSQFTPISNNIMSAIGQPNANLASTGQGTQFSGTPGATATNATPDVTSRLQNLSNMGSYMGGVDPNDIASLNKQIAEQQTALTQFTPQQYLASEPGLKNIGITESALERRVAQEREPVQDSLSRMLIAKSYIGEQYNLMPPDLREFNILKATGQIPNDSSYIQYLGEKMGNRFIPVSRIDPFTQQPYTVTFDRFTGQEVGSAATQHRPGLGGSTTPTPIPIPNVGTPTLTGTTPARQPSLAGLNPVTKSMARDLQSVPLTYIDTSKPTGAQRTAVEGDAKRHNIPFTNEERQIIDTADGAFASLQGAIKLFKNIAPQNVGGQAVSVGTNLISGIIKSQTGQDIRSYNAAKSTLELNLMPALEKITRFNEQDRKLLEQGLPEYNTLRGNGLSQFKSLVSMFENKLGALLGTKIPHNPIADSEGKPTITGGGGGTIPSANAAQGGDPLGIRK